MSPPGSCRLAVAARRVSCPAEEVTVSQYLKRRTRAGAGVYMGSDAGDSRATTAAPGGHCIPGCCCESFATAHQSCCA